jgi:DHA1 family tetracycline resistance protein-like MFS transporter
MRQVPESSYFLPILLVVILDAMSTGIMLPVLAPLVSADHGILSAYSLEMRHTIYGYVLGAFNCCFMLGAPIWGYLSDFWGRKKVLLFCLMGTALSFLLYIFSFHFNSLRILLIGRMVGGLTSGCQGVAQAAIAERSIGEQKAANIGLIAVGMTIGLVTGPLIGGFFSDHQWVSWFSATTPFYVSIFLSLFSFIFLWGSFREKDYGKNEHNFTYFKSYMTEIFSKKSLLILLSAFFFFELGWSLYFQSLALLLIQKYDFSSSLVGLFSSYVGFALCLGLIFLVRFCIQRWKLAKMIKIALFVATITLIFAFFSHHRCWQWLVATIIANAVAVGYAGMIALASDQIDASKQGFLMGSTDAIIGLAFTLTGLLSGVIAYYSPALPQFLAGLFMVLGLIIFRFNKGTHKECSYINTEK